MTAAERLEHGLLELAEQPRAARARAGFRALAGILSAEADRPRKHVAPASDLLAGPGPGDPARHHLAALAAALDGGSAMRVTYHARRLGRALFPEHARWRPTVSVVIPMHNRSELAVRAVESCLAQSHAPSEIIVVDDGSHDEPDRRLAQFGAAIRLVRQSHRGVSAARNHGMRLATGDFVHFLDADDRLAPTCLAAKLAAFDQAADADLCTSLYEVEGENGAVKQFSRRVSPLGDEYCPTVDFMSTVVRRFALSNCTALAPRCVWFDVGPFDEDLRQGEDVRYWFRMALRGVKVVAVRRALSVIHLNPGSLTTDREENLRYCGYALLRNMADLVATPQLWRHADAFLHHCWDEALQTVLASDDAETARLRRYLTDLVHHVPRIAEAWNASPRPLLRAIESNSASRTDIDRVFAETRAFRSRLLNQHSSYRRQLQRRRMDEAGIVAVLPWKRGVLRSLRRSVALTLGGRGGNLQSAALAYAASQGETEAAERLLASGLDPNVRDARGDTPLHRALRAGHAQTAACLLAYGADHRLTDRDGRAPLDSAHVSVEMLHAVRQQHRRFRPRLKRHDASRPAHVAHRLAELELLGITKIPGLVEPQTLACLQSEFARFMESLQTKVARGEGRYRHYDEEEHFWEADGAYVCNNAFKYCATLVEVSRIRDIAAVIDAYFGRPAHITRANAMRYLPLAERHNDMFGWHHDMEDSRVKLMVLLTDVEPHDQHMSYVLRSHTLLHPYEMFLRNECSLDYCRERLGTLELFHATGNAGDAFLFDSNGAHRGKRSAEGRTRDALFVEYTTDDSDVWGGDIPRDVLAALEPASAEAFRWMLDAPKKWEQPVTRAMPTWAENLRRVESWLGQR